MKKYLIKLGILALVFVSAFTLSSCEPPEEKECDPGYVENKAGECVLEEVPVVDETAPVISGAVNINYTMEDPEPDYTDGVSASDDTDGDITSSIVVDSSAVDLTVEGTYQVTYTVSDQAGNSETVSIDVIVSVRELTDQEKALLDMAEIDLTGDEIVLPRFGANGTFFYWSSSNLQVMSASGFIVNPPIGSDPVEVILSLRAINGTHIETKEYMFTVEPNPEVEIGSVVQLPFEGTSEEYVVEDNPAVNIFYPVDGNLPYIDIETFIDLINGAIESDEVVFTPVGDDQLEISYEVEWEDVDGTMVTETYTALVDFTENTFTVNNFDFFESYVASTESDYGEGLNYVDAEYVDGSEVTIPLGNYNFDLVIYDNAGELEYLMPFHVTNLIFAGGVYYDVFYNGDKLWGIDTFGISGSDADDLALQELTRTSSLNAEDMPDDVKLATLNFLGLAFDYFYGLKEDRGVDTYLPGLILQAENFIDGSDNTVYRKMFNIAYDMDDLHTSHAFVGHYIDTPETTLSPSISDMGPRVTSFYNGLWDIQDLLEEKWGSTSSVPTSRVIDDGKTAIFFIDGFSIDTPGEFKEFLDALPGTVENVVIDLSYNTGGNIGAVFRMFGYMTEETFYYHSQNPADGSAATYHIESDYVAYDYDWYIVSSSVTFSAANMMVSMAKETGIATIMGQKSSGGASSIGVIIAPDGTGMLISTNNVLSTRVGNEVDGFDYLSVEDGIEVDYIMSNVTDEAEIIAIIAQHQASESE